MVRSAGLIRRMKTYSVVLDSGALYLLAVGPAMRATRAYDPLTQAALSPIAAHYEVAVRAGERRLTEEGLDRMSVGKDCFKLVRNDLLALELKRDLYGIPRLVLRTTRGTIRFQFPNHAFEQVQVLVEALRRR
ncbi:MAG: hypothetical protein M0R80_00455 [Proteobacteria bacterium]|nr:hypothetical protein [Pseudomonadota bacterium]